jgi:CTP:molybdopterin cytidylyltransferase MocA/molybdenum-dependent DNA-binding transcriptional regulator ModE
MAEIDEMSPIYTLIALFNNAEISRVLIADSKNADTIKHNATKLGADFIFGKRIEIESAAGCVLAGVKYLPQKYERLLITPSNFPFFEVETVKTLCASDADIAVPLYKGKRGYPVLVARSMFDELKNCNGELDAFLDANSGKVSEIEVDDEGVTADVSSVANAHELAAKHSIYAKLRPDKRIYVAQKSDFVGPGVLQLIKLVDEVKSVQSARIVMGMTSSKMQDIVHEVEKMLGFKLFWYDASGRPGGSGYSYLTPECRAFAEKYEAYTNDCANYIHETFSKYFPD